MGQSSVRGDRPRHRDRRARDLGWDDSLYEGGNGPGPGAAAGGSGDGGDGDSDSGDGSGSGSGGDRGGEDRRSGPPSRKGGGSSGRKKRGKGRILRLTAIVLSLLILAVAGAGYLYYNHLNSILKKDELTLGDKAMADHKANAAGQTPMNILLIGSDARNTAENKKLGGARDTFDSPPLADVQMLVHVSADRSNISAVSMPRDTLLKMPKCTDPDTDKVYPASTGLMMTNESLGRGGPGCTVAAWYNLTGITIDHFMMIDFGGVVSMADAIGGVPVCVTDNVSSRDSQGHGSGLKLKKGTTKVQGEQALQWLRTRYGFEDGTDLARTHAQHMYMNSMVRELKKNTKLSDPIKLRKLAEAATRALTVDEDLGTVKKLYDLAEDLKQVPASRITMTTMPWQYSQIQAGKVEPKKDEAEQLFRMVREDTPLDGKASKKQKPKAKAVSSKDEAAPAAEIAVLVQNGTGSATAAPVRGRAAAVTQILVAKGFTLARADTRLSPQERTTVLFPSVDLEGDAQAAAKAIGVPLTSVRKSTDASGVTLVVGADWRTGSVVPKAAAKADDKTPESARALNGEDTGACMKVDKNFTW